MLRFKTLLIAGFAAFAAIGTNPTPTQAGGHPPTIPATQPQARVFWVYYRTCPHDTWRCYGGYYNQNHAILAVNFFKSRGYDAFYR